MPNENRRPGEGTAACNDVLGNVDTSQSSNKTQKIARFADIPDELKSLKQWLCWRYDYDNSTERTTKVPINPSTGYKASHSDASTWGTFEQSVAAFRDRDCDGIGFVFTEDDPYAGIDLDDTNGNAWLKEKHDGIFNAFDSYAELSPSGTGLHIIVRGAIPHGRRGFKAEVYSSHRFFTMTGNVYRAAPITDRNDLLNQLWVDLRSNAKPRANEGFDAPEREMDGVICARMFGAANGEKARDLYEGRWQQYYPHSKGQSEADFALIDIIAYYTQNRAQIARIFRASALGQRKKAQRADYVDDMIGKAFDRMLPPVDYSRFFAAKADDEPADELPWVDADELDGKSLPERQWLVPGWIPHANVTLIYSDGGGGKSTLAAQLCASTVLGRDWIGLPVTRQGTALHFAAEDDLTDDHIRRAAIANALGVRLADLKGFVTMPFAGHDARMAIGAGRGDALSVTPLFHRVEAKIAALRPAVAVLDNLADVFDGNEISRNQARWFIGQLRRVAIEHNVAIVVTAHPSRDGIKTERGDSGSTAWSNSVRSRLYLMDDPDNADRRTLKVAKANYAKKGSEVPLNWVFGTFHAVGHAADKTAHNRASDKAVDDLFLEILADFKSRGQHVVRAHNSKDYAAKLFAAHELAKAANVNFVGFKFALNRLFAEGRIRDELIGPPSKAKAVIVAVAP